jgi:outer membrane lipoprotein-sorting protein
MQRFFALCALAVCATLLGGAGQPAPARRIDFTPEQQAALDRVSTYLNGIHTLKSGFMQLGPEGQLDQGEFLLEKPGKLRFSYDPPNPTLVVATGGKIYVKNNRLNTVENYDVSDVPLDLLLSDKINLKANPAITGIEIQNDALVVHARTSSNRQQGNITLVFSSPAIELRQWTVKDNQGGTTMVALHNPEAGAALDESLFAVPVKNPPVRKTP